MDDGSICVDAHKGQRGLVREPAGPPETTEFPASAGGGPRGEAGLAARSDQGRVTPLTSRTHAGGTGRPRGIQGREAQRVACVVRRRRSRGGVRTGRG